MRRKKKSKHSPAKSKVHTDQNILAAAQNLFAIKGFEGVTIRDISEATGANPALVSYYFGDKIGLYRKCLENIGNKRLAFAERFLVMAPSSPEDVRLRLALFVEDIIESYLEDPTAMLLVHRECENQTNLSEDIFRKIFVAVFDHLKNFLAMSQRAKYIKPGVDIHLATIIFFGATVNFTRTEALNDKYFKVSLRSNDFRKRVVASLVEIFWEGVRVS